MATWNAWKFLGGGGEARTLLGAPGIATRNKKLLGAPESQKQELVLEFKLEFSQNVCWLVKDWTGTSRVRETNNLESSEDYWSLKSCSGQSISLPSLTISLGLCHFLPEPPPFFPTGGGEKRDGWQCHRP